MFGEQLNMKLVVTVGSLEKAIELFIRVNQSTWPVSA